MTSGWTPVHHHDPVVRKRSSTKAKNRPQAAIREAMTRASLARVRRGMALAACVVLSACNSDSGGLGPWQEEVQISDGRVILVERFEDSTVRKPIADAGGAFLDETLMAVVAPAEQATTLLRLTTRYRPLILDFDPKAATWFVIAFDERVCMQPIPEAIHEGIMDKTGRVNLRPNFEYRLQQGAWVEVPVAPERIGLSVNLLIQRMTVEQRMDEHQPVRLDEKKRLDSHPRLPKEYRHVVARVGCG